MKILIFSEPPKRFFLDGVCLSQSGMSRIQSLVVPVPKIKRNRRSASKPEVRPPIGSDVLTVSSQPGISRLLSIQSQSSMDGDENLELLKGIVFQYNHTSICL